MYLRTDLFLKKLEMLHVSKQTDSCDISNKQLPKVKVFCGLQQTFVRLSEKKLLASYLMRRTTITDLFLKDCQQEFPRSVRLSQ